MNYRNIWGIPLLLFVVLLAACAPLETPVPPTAVPTFPALTIQDLPTPTAMPITPLGESTILGFNIRGWT
jgi:hypothetical protein